MKKIYIAGPYSSPDGYKGEDANTNVAARIAAEYFKLGWAVFCPHTMTRDIARKFARELTWEDWLTTDIAWLICCDAIHLCPGWDKSKGATLEFLVAKGKGLCIFEGEHASSEYVFFEPIGKEGCNDAELRDVHPVWSADGGSRL